MAGNGKHDPNPVQVASLENELAMAKMVKEEEHIYEEPPEEVRGLSLVYSFQCSLLSPQLSVVSTSTV